MNKVSVRGGFSDRNSIKSENKTIQLKKFDDRTRIQLLNMINELCDITFKDEFYDSNEKIQNYIKYVRKNIYCEVNDIGIIYSIHSIQKKIRETILEDEYDSVLTLIETIVKYFDNYLIEENKLNYYDKYNKKYRGKSLFDLTNMIFEKEYIGYRFVDKIIVPISDEFEVKTIEETFCNNYEPVRNHMEKANKLLSDRSNPDYENSIKESISAVEAILEIITGCKGGQATLGNMLNKLANIGIDIPNGLKQAFKTLYGYTSSEKGIRHAGNIEGKNSTFEEAKFMLVTCCAFINYLTALKKD